MGCTTGSIIREAGYALLHPSIYPFYGLNILYGMTQSMDLESQLGTASTVVLKAAPIWYLVLYSKFVEPRRRLSVAARENSVRQSYSGSRPCESPNAIISNCDPPLTASFRTERVMAFSKQSHCAVSSATRVSTTQEPSTSDKDRASTAGNSDNVAVGPSMGQNTRSSRDENDKQYKKYFICGLLLSSIGDGLLVFPSTFLPGVLMFGVAHVFYILGLRKRFSQRSSDYGYAWLVFPIGMMMSPYLLLGIESHSLGTAIVAYNLTINTMLYQAVSAVEKESCNSSAFLAMLGAVSFVFSDSMLALHRWKFSLPYPTLLVMSTYYFAQVCFALSIY